MLCRLLMARRRLVLRTRCSTRNFLGSGSCEERDERVIAVPLCVVEGVPSMDALEPRNDGITWGGSFFVCPGDETLNALNNTVE